MSKLEYSRLQSQRVDEDRQKRINKFLATMHKELHLPGDPPTAKLNGPTAAEIMRERKKPDPSEQHRKIEELSRPKLVGISTKAVASIVDRSVGDHSLLLSPKREHEYLRAILEDPQLEATIEADLERIKLGIKQDRSRSVSPEQRTMPSDHRLLRRVSQGKSRR